MIHIATKLQTRETAGTHARALETGRTVHARFTHYYLLRAARNQSLPGLNGAESLSRSPS